MDVPDLQTEISPAEMIAEQKEKISKQRQEFKNLVSDMEKQQVESKNEAIALKMVLELSKVFGLWEKVYYLSLDKAFQRYKMCVAMKNQVLKARSGIVWARFRGKVKQMILPIRANLKRALTASIMRWKSIPAAQSNTREQIDKTKAKLQRLKRTTEKLRQKEAGIRAKRDVMSKGGNQEDQLEMENRALREKLAQTEANVGIFVREMGSLLDQHEPPGMSTRDDQNAYKSPALTKGTKVQRMHKGKGRKGQSPEDKFGAIRRSGERKNYLQFD